MYNITGDPCVPNQNGGGSEEGTYLACSVTPTFAAVRGALNRAGVPTGTSCVAPNGTVPATRATAVLTGGAAAQLPYASVFTNFGNNDTYSVFADACCRCSAASLT